MTFSSIDVKVPGGTSQNNEPQMLNEAKPDFLDFDKDGDKKEPMKKALRDKKKKMDSPTKDEPEGENGDTASMNPKIGDKTKKEYSMSMKPSKKKLYMSKNEAYGDGIESQKLVEYPLVTKKANFYDRSDHLKLAQHHEKQFNIHQDKHDDHVSKGGSDDSHHEYHALLHFDAMEKHEKAAHEHQKKYSFDMAPKRAKITQDAQHAASKEAHDASEKVKNFNKDKIDHKHYGKLKYEQVNVDDILSLDEASFDNYIDDMTIEELKELEEGIIGGTVKMIGKGIGALAKGAMGAGKLAAKGASAAANRMSASGRADAAERKLAKVRNKAVDIQRRIRAKKAAKVIARGGYSKYDPAKFQQKRVNYQMAHTEYEGEVMKESPIRTALKSVVENRGEHYRSATPPETIDDKLKGGGAKKMKADLMKGAKMNDTVAKAPEDAKAAGSRGPSAKPRSSGDNIRKGDTKIVQGGTPMKDPSSPKQRLESIMNAYSSMQEKNVNELSMKTLQRYRDVAAGDIQVKKGQAKIRKAADTVDRQMSGSALNRKADNRQAQRQIAKGKMMIKKAKPSPTRYSSDGGSIERMGNDATKSSITKKRTESFSGTGVGTLGNIMDAYQSMNQQKSLNEAMHHLANYMREAETTPEGGYKRDKHRAQSNKMHMHHKEVASLHRTCADKLATDPHHGPGSPLHIAHHAAADAHEQAKEHHQSHHDDHDADKHVSADFDIDQQPKTNAKNKEQFAHAMRSTVKAMSLSSETHHIAKETR